ncbi:MAG: fibronectin type III domain-containing protein, partial [bacterium]
MGLFIISSDGAITRYPHVQPTVNLETFIVITWQTDNQAGGTVYYGINDLNKTADAILNIKGDDEYSLRPQITTRHGKYQYYVKLENLSPGTQYKYKVVSDNTETEVYKFTTSSSDDNFSYRIAVMADNHFHEDTASTQQEADPFLPIIRSYDPHLVMILGDVA